MSQVLDKLSDIKINSTLLQQLCSTTETFWVNPVRTSLALCHEGLPLNFSHLQDATERLSRFAPYIAESFPETAQTKGEIESQLMMTLKMRDTLTEYSKRTLPKNLFVKLDSHLPISGSIKARGGVYEVLKFAEEVAVLQGELTLASDYRILQTKRYQELFNRYTIVVGSTGNLGTSIGIIGAKLGFKVVVHMSSDARSWKKALLRSIGVEVIEHAGSYSMAVAKGRSQAQTDEYCHFVDDEASTDLFLGYGVAAKRVQRQFENLGVTVDKDHPLFVYLPCGVGGGPGGITFGLKNVYDENVHCFFGEPTQTPAMLVGLSSGYHDKISTTQLGLSSKTDADGLAVSRPSGLVCQMMDHLLSGCYTVTDHEMYKLLSLLFRAEQLQLEPSAVVGFAGYLRAEEILDKLHVDRQRFNRGTHLVWATGGSMVPEKVWHEYDAKGKSLLALDQ